MKMKKVFLMFSIILFGLVLQVPMGLSSTPKNSGTETVQKSSDLTFNYSSNTQPPFQDKPKAPDVWNTVGNITQFHQPNTTVYSGNDVIPSQYLPRMQWTYLTINVTAIKIISDPGGNTGSENYFLRWVSNYWLGYPDSDWSNYTGLFSQSPYTQISIGSGWNNYTTPIELFSGWTVLSTLYLEVWEYHAILGNQSLGGTGWLYENMSSILGYHELLTDSGDAILAINITASGTDNTFTAEDMAELFQPYLFDDSGTFSTSSYSKQPSDVLARVIQGYDSEIGMGSLCIQYLYYWNEVLIPHVVWGDDFVCYNDYELVQLYLNLTYTGFPIAYRYVFDNHDLLTNTSTEWRDSMTYTILEWNHANTGLNHKQIYNTPDLRPLLGDSYNANYTYENLTQYLSQDNGYCSCYGGVASIILTVATCYHQFALGETSGSTALGQYNINAFNDTMIRRTYDLLNETFTGGVHTVNGEIVPKYSPFAYDVEQVFTAPYIHNNFDHLMQEADNLQQSDESGGVSINIQHSINVSIQIPIDMNTTIPTTMNPGDQFQTTLNTHILTDETVIKVDYFFNITANVNLFFLQDSFSSIIQNQLIINFSDPVLNMIIQTLGLNDEQKFSLPLLSNMLTVEGVFDPHILGQILNCNFTFHINKILDNFIPEYSGLTDLIFKDIYIKVNPVINGNFTADLKLGTATKSVEWDSTYGHFPVTMTVPSGSNGDNLLFDLTNFLYGLNLNVNWWAGVQFGDLISWAIPDFNALLGTWPQASTTLPFSGSLSLESYSYHNNQWIASTVSPKSIPGYPIISLFVAIFLGSGLCTIQLIRLKRYSHRN